LTRKKAVVQFVGPLKHILLSCPLVRIIWRNVKWPLAHWTQASSFGSLPITDWIKAFLIPQTVLNISVSEQVAHIFF